MTIINARCNNCGAELTYNSEKAILYCPYCGSKQIIIEGDEVKVAKAKFDAYREVELSREETEREKNRLEHEREKEKIDKGENIKIEKERIKAERKAQTKILRHEKKMAELSNRQHRKSLWESIDKDARTVIIILGSIFVMGFIILGLIVETPESAKRCIGKQYEIVEQQFRDAGFWFVKCEAYNDLSDGWIFKDTDKIGKVKEVSVNGNTSFKKNAEYTRFTPVMIYYHDYP